MIHEDGSMYVATQLVCTYLARGVDVFYRSQREWFSGLSCMIENMNSSYL